MKTAIVVGAFLGKFLQSDPFVKKEIADSSPPESPFKDQVLRLGSFSNFFFLIFEKYQRRITDGERRRDVTASPEVLCSQVHDVQPLLCWDVQLFHFQRRSDGKKKTSAGERERQPIERDPEVHTTSVTSPKHQATGRQRERRRNGRKPREGEADRHRVMTVMSKWSDTGERGETNRDGQRDRQSEDAERGNLRETCHNNVTSGKNGDAAAPRVQYRNVDGRPERFRWKYPCVSTQIKSRQRKIATWLED